MPSLIGPPIHICSGPACCSSEADSLDKAVGVMQEVFLHSITVPALNKWTTVAPCMTLVAAMQQFCDVIPEAFSRCFLAGAPAESSDDDSDEGDQLGVPRDQTKVWRKLARKRQKKAAHFLQDPESKFLTMLWGICSFPVMKVHYILFKRGTWLSERSDEEDIVSSTASFCNPRLNPAAKAASDIADLLLDSVLVGWTPLAGLYGPVFSWNQRRLQTTRRCLFTEMGQLYRKLLEPWKRYPWKLVELPALAEPQKRAAAHFFFQVPDCCLDGFSHKLKKFVRTIDGLLAPETLDFLAEVFDRVVPTSTFIERAFARLSRWCDRKGPKPQLSTLAAKNAVYHFRYLTERWRAKARKLGIIHKAKSQRCRPPWAHGVRKGRGTNGLHMFAKAQGLNPSSGLQRQWRLQPREERQRFASLARASNLQARVVQNSDADMQRRSQSVTGGFWGMSSATGFPLDKAMVSKHLDDLKLFAQRYRQSTQSLLPEAPDGFQGAPPMPCSLWAQCEVGFCPHQLSQRQQEYFKSLHDMLMHVIISKGPAPTIPSKDPLVLEFRSESARASRHVVIAYNTRKKPIESALMELKRLPEADVPPGFLQVLACEKGVDGQFPLTGDAQFCVSLASEATDWELRVLTIGPIRELRLFDVAAAEVVDLKALMLEVASAKEFKKALDALKKLERKESSRPASGTKPTVPARQAGPRKGQGKGKALPNHEGESDMDHGGSSQSDQAEEESEDADDDPLEPMGLAGVPPPPRPPAPVDQAPVDHRRRNVRRGHIWGSRPSFQIAPIIAHGSVEPKAFGAICGMHKDPSNPTLQCKKAMSCAGLSHEECILRLKRWLVAGLDTDGWGENKRDAHMSMGGLQLCHFAAGLTAQDLDRCVREGC